MIDPTPPIYTVAIITCVVSVVLDFLQLYTKDKETKDQFLPCTSGVKSSTQDWTRKSLAVSLSAKALLKEAARLHNYSLVLLVLLNFIQPKSKVFKSFNSSVQSSLAFVILFIVYF